MSAVKASPAELRAASRMSGELIGAGIDFVPVIVESEEHKQNLLAQLMSQLEKMQKEAV